MNSKVLAFLGSLSIVLIAGPVFASLHPGDRINVTVLNHPELSVAATVDSAGNVSVPVAGTVPALSIEPEQLAVRIESRLSQYVRKPAVVVQLIAQNDSIFVSGGPSGVLKYQPGETLTSVVDQLEITPAQRPQSVLNPNDVPGQQPQVPLSPLDLFNGPVDFRQVSIVRDEKTLGPFDVLKLRSDGLTGPSLQPNDTIRLLNKPIAVHISGDVTNSGVAYLDPTDPLSHALDQVGGSTATSSQTAIVLVRSGSSQTVSLGSPVFSLPAQSGDQLIFPRAPRVDVLGTVVKPGEQYLRGSQTLVAAIYYAGGPDKYANLRSVQVLHNGVRKEYNLAHLQKGHGGDNPDLVDGDVIFVPQGSTLDAATIFQAIGALGYLIYR